MNSDSASTLDAASPESEANTVAQDEAEPVPIGKPLAAANEHKRRERLTPSNFIMLAATVVAAVSGLLAGRFSTLTIALVALGSILALAVGFTGLTSTRWFSSAASWTVIIALLVAGPYIAAKGRQAQASPPPQNLLSSLPAIRLAQTGAHAVCQVYYGTGTIPQGYELLIFTSPPGGSYYLEGPAVNQGNGKWSSPLVMAGNNPTVISPVLVPKATGNLLNAISLYSDQNAAETEITSGKLGLVWLLTSLPDSSETIPSLTVYPPNGLSGCPSGY